MIITFCGHRNVSDNAIITDRLTDAITKLFLKAMTDSLPISFEISRQRLNSKLKDVIGAIALDISEYGSSKVDMSITSNVNTLDELNDYDKDIIISTLKNLGRSDIDSQNNIIENAITIVQKQIKEANTNKVKSSKVYRTVGVITGLIIVVIFI